MNQDELILLKEFLGIKVETLQQRVSELLNEKEDLEAIHTSSSEVKEHLLHQVNELNR